MPDPGAGPHADRSHAAEFSAHGGDRYLLNRMRGLEEAYQRLLAENHRLKAENERLKSEK